MRLLLALVFIASIAPTASAKCGHRFFVVSGLVLNSSGAPVSGALVGASWIEHSTPSGPAMATTGPDGGYSIPLRFNTNSGYSLFGDKCHGLLKQISVSAHSNTHRSDFTLVPVSDKSQINVAPLRIDTPIQREPLWPDEAGG